MNTNSSENNVAAADEKKHPRPQPEDAVKCPRCDSGNTKFCYYNNYSLSQPRYFCKACRRYWTKGGTLRNVPVGGGCRKKKRSAERHHHQLMVQSQVENNVMSSASAHSKLPLSSFSSPLRFEDSPGTGDSLSLAFARLQKQCNNGYLGLDQFDLHHQPAHPVFGNPVTNLGFLSNLHETQTTSFDSQSMYNYGFGNGGAQDHQSHTQPLLPSEDLSLSNLSAAPTTEVFSLMSGSVKQEMCGNIGMNDSRILFGLPWQMGNNGVPSSSTENLLLGSNNNNSYNYNNGRESWNSTGLAAAQSWPNLINSTALM